jgi:hypothetical protein
MDNELARINQGSILTFNGSSNKYTMWWTKFKAYANINGFSDAIREKPNPDMPTSWFGEINLTTETGKKQFQAKKNERSGNGKLHNGFHERRDYAFG